MNWRRTLLRMWFICSIAWIGLLFAMDNPTQKIRDPMVAYQDKFPFAQARASGLSDDQIAAYLSRHAVFDFGKLAALPPAIFLVGVLFAIRGSRRAPSN